MAKVKTVRLDIPQGATYIHTFTHTEQDEVTPIDLTGFTARLQMRSTVKSSTVLHEATTSNGGIAITPASGVVDLRISATDTAGFAFTRAVYDLEIEAPDGTVTRIVKGSIVVDPEVTR